MIELPFPPSSLSGHNKGHWRSKSGIVAKHREWAKNATLASHPVVPPAGDIRVVTTFYPPDNRGDRVNFPNRMKPYFDGIADALKVNDKRFLPVFHFGEPAHVGKVVIFIGEGSERFVVAATSASARWRSSSTSTSGREPRASPRTNRSSSTVFPDEKCPRGIASPGSAEA